MTRRVLFKRIRDPKSGIRDAESGLRNPALVNPKRTTDPGQRIPTPKMPSPLLHSKTTSQLTTRDTIHVRNSFLKEFLCATIDARRVNLATV